MSGFVALLQMDGAPVNRELLERLTETLRPRGPDQQRVWIDGPVGFGHALFRTTDEAQFDQQPNSLDGEVWITANARIDGRTELLDQLGLSHQIQLAKTPDSDLILHAYRAWGEGCVEHLIGDFAFAIWDSRRRRLFCARDRFGMNQLYYARLGQTLLISNTLDCMLQHPGISRRLDERAIGDFLLFGDHTWPDKTQTSFADIRTLPPAHCLTLDGDHLEERRYWEFPQEVPLFRYKREEEVLECFRELFRKAVADRLRTSQAVVAISGGLDSTAIAATVRDLQKEGGPDLDLQGVCVLYDSIHPSDERRFATLATDWLGLETQFLDGGDYPLLAPYVPTTRPLETYQPVLWYEFERIAAAKGRVMLTGEAGDNLLTYSPLAQATREAGLLETLLQIIRLRAIYGSTPGLGTGLLARLRNWRQGGGKGAVAPYAYPTWLDTDFENRMELEDRWREWWSWHPSPLNPRHPKLQAALVGPDWSVDDSYSNSDSPLPEKRDPFLDLRMVDFVLSLPPLPWLFKKHLLRRAMAGKLPTEVLKRPKTLLGAIHEPLLTLPGTEWVDQWQPEPKLAQFIDRRNIPSLTGPAGEESDAYVNLRPLLLNKWLGEMART